ncbi:uncharacterized protein LOC110349082 [Heterocephalus glaber]|uniref:Uncharacterized protein LOC110349082 n=1 Tax=Heterocephalus glaber TaxID=10181 RepID=A0AAX6SZW4_HETGA|nr:uncharacterized protein LOC110349082 [Heterocephalus glaber]
MDRMGWSDMLPTMRDPTTMSTGVPVWNRLKQCVLHDEGPRNSIHRCAWLEQAGATCSLQQGTLRPCPQVCLPGMGSSFVFPMTRDLAMAFTGVPVWNRLELCVPRNEGHCNGIHRCAFPKQAITACLQHQGTLRRCPQFCLSGMGWISMFPMMRDPVMALTGVPVWNGLDWHVPCDEGPRDGIHRCACLEGVDQHVSHAEGPCNGIHRCACL